MAGLINIQKRIGEKPDGLFTNETAKAIMNFFQLNEVSAAHLIGQCLYVSKGFTEMEENLDISTDELINDYSRQRISIMDAYKYGRREGQQANREMIANIIYGGEWGRMNMGNKDFGDGWKHRGMGALLIKGKRDQDRFADYIGNRQIKKQPGLISEKYALDSAHFYFEDKNIYQLCLDMSDYTIEKVTMKINPSKKGLEDRKNQTMTVLKYLTSK